MYIIILITCNKYSPTICDVLADETEVEKYIETKSLFETDIEHFSFDLILDYMVYNMKDAEKFEHELAIHDGGDNCPCCNPQIIIVKKEDFSIINIINDLCLY